MDKDVRGGTQRAAAYTVRPPSLRPCATLTVPDTTATAMMSTSDAVFHDAGAGAF
jgi:hypothetical protein